MVYELTDVRDIVRAMVPNITPTVVSDSILTVHIRQALRRLSADRPFTFTEEFDGTGDKFFDLSAVLADWVEGYSVVTRLVREPVEANSEQIREYRHGEDFVVYVGANGDTIRFASAPAADDDLMASYTTTWKIEELDGAASTTVPERYKNALEFMAAAILCFSQAGESAGNVSSFMPGDLINYETKGREFIRAGEAWIRQYDAEISRGEGVPAAAGAKREYPQETARGTSYLTHRR